MLLIVRIAALVFAGISTPLLVLGSGDAGLVLCGGYLAFFFLSAGAQSALKQRRPMPARQAWCFAGAIVAGCLVSVLSAWIMSELPGIDTGIRATGVFVAIVPVVIAITLGLAVLFVIIQRFPKAPAGSQTSFAPYARVPDAPVAAPTSPAPTLPPPPSSKDT